MPKTEISIRITDIDEFKSLFETLIKLRAHIETSDYIDPDGEFLIEQNVYQAFDQALKVLMEKTVSD